MLHLLERQEVRRSLFREVMWANAFTTAVDGISHIGGQGLKCKWGTWTNTAGSTGGSVPTGFAFLAGLTFMNTSHFNSAAPKVTATASDGDVTIVTEADVDGKWMAFGIGEAS